MSTTQKRTFDTDQYTVLNTYDVNNNCEIALVQSLVQSAYDKNAITPDASGIYISPASGDKWNVSQINETYINTSAIANYPVGSVPEFSAISTSLFQEDVSVNVYTTNISSNTCNNNEMVFQTLTSSAPYYDVNYVITQSLIADCVNVPSDSDLSGNYVVATFDTDASNAKIQYAMQSRWNTITGPYNGLETVGPDPVTMCQDVSFNTLQAFGMEGTVNYNANESGDYTSKWASLDGDGKVIFYNIDASNQPINNNLIVSNRDMSGVILTENDVGAYKIVLSSKSITTKIYHDNSSLNSVDANTSELTAIPLFNNYGSDGPLPFNANKADLHIPGVMTSDQFDSLFNNGVFNTIAEDWTFKIDISSNNGGYAISDEHPLMSDLNNDNLLDNPYYMEHYVKNNHTIQYTPGILTIIPDTSGNLTDASSVAIDLVYGEELNETHAGVDGQFILNTNTTSTRYTDLSENTVAAYTFIPNVYYQSDTNISTNQLTEEEKTNYYFEAMWQKVAQQTVDLSSNIYLKQSNGAILTLFNDDKIVDTSYNATDFNFSFNSTLFDSSSVNLWKLNAVNNIIVDVESLYKSASYGSTSRQRGISTTGILTNLQEDLTYNSYRVKLTAKQKESLGLSDAALNAGWALIYNTTGISYLQTSSTNAFSTDVLPIYNPAVINALIAGTDICFNYTYGTNVSGTNSGSLSDYVNVEYNYDGSTNILGQFTIDQNNITRAYSTNPNIQKIPVSTDDYVFTGGIYNKTNWELVHVTAQTTYSAYFNPHYGAYTNLQLRLDNIAQQNIFYAVRNKISGLLAGANALDYVSSSTITTLHQQYETITPPVGSSLTISGVFTANDLKPFIAEIQGENMTSVWTTIGTIGGIDADAYYGLSNTDSYVTPNNASVTFNLEYSPFIETVNASINVLLTNQTYYIPFVYNRDNASYSLSSLNMGASDISSNTKISSDTFKNNVDYLNIQDKYSAVTNWNYTNYTLSPIYDTASQKTTFIAYNTSGETVFQLEVLNNTIFLGDFMVSYIPHDMYRAERILGHKLSDAQLTYFEKFFFNDYQDDINLANADINGIIIRTTVDMSSNISSRPILGDYQSFRILGDFMNINPVGDATSPTGADELGVTNGGSLTFQYIDASAGEYSAYFTFPTYRGYNSYTTNYNQNYTIERTSTIVKFIVDASGTYSQIVDEITANMYIYQPFSVSSLVDTNGFTVANLGITGNFYYSIPPISYDLSYDVIVSGDAVTISFLNPNYLGSSSNIPVDPSATPVDNPRTYTFNTTLYEYNRDSMYTFSGIWHATNKLMGIRPSRVKLQTALYDYSYITYEIKNLGYNIQIFKARNQPTVITLPSSVISTIPGEFNWLGNPVLCENWHLVDIIDLSSARLNGIDIGRKNISPNLDFAINFAVLYIVSAPPRYIFTQMSTNNCPIIPYNYGVDYIDNKLTRYMHYVDASMITVNTFNPFLSGLQITDFNNNHLSIQNNINFMNNITFTLSDINSVNSAWLNPDETVYHIIVPGTNIKVDLYVGLDGSGNVGMHTNPIWNAPITDIPFIPDIENSPLLLKGRDASGVITFSALQYPSDIGYPVGETGYLQVLGTDLSRNWYNIDFSIDSPSWFNNNLPKTVFNMNANGIKPVLYTVVDINDQVTQRNKRRVYKYISAGVLDIDFDSSNSSYQTFNISFNSRMYHDFDISLNSLSFTNNSTGIWDYSVLLDNTVIPDTSINWITDTSYTELTTISWAFGNAITANNLLVEMFGVQDTQQKWVYIHLEPFIRYMNQFNLPISSVSWDGVVTAPQLSTRVIKLNEAISQPYLNNNTNTIQQYSTSTLN